MKTKKKNNRSIIFVFVFLFSSIVYSLLSIVCFAQSWQEMRGDHFIVYYEKQDRAFAADTLRDAEYYYTDIATDLGYARYSNFWQWEKRVKIFIYPGQDSFLKATGQPSWSVGNANYATKSISSFSGSGEFLQSILPHEIAHLIFRDFVGFAGEVPLWLDEGVAQWQEKPKRQLVKYYVRTLYEKKLLIPSQGTKSGHFRISEFGSVSFLGIRHRWIQCLYHAPPGAKRR